MLCVALQTDNWRTAASTAVLRTADKTSLQLAMANQGLLLFSRSWTKRRTMTLTTLYSHTSLRSSGETRRKFRLEHHLTLQTFSGRALLSLVAGRHIVPSLLMERSAPAQNPVFYGADDQTQGNNIFSPADYTVCNYRKAVRAGLYRLERLLMLDLCRAMFKDSSRRTSRNWVRALRATRHSLDGCVVTQVL